MCVYRRMQACINFLAEVEASMLFVSHRNNHICFNPSANLSGARFSLWSFLSGLLADYVRLPALLHGFHMTNCAISLATAGA